MPGFVGVGHICDVIKQNESELANSDFKIKPNKGDYVFCLPIVFATCQQPISLEPIDKFSGVFCKM